MTFGESVKRAVAEGKRSFTEDQKKKETAAQQLLAEQKREMQQILFSVPDRCKKAAAEGKTRLEIIQANDSRCFANHDAWQRANKYYPAKAIPADVAGTLLGGVPFLIFKELTEQGLSPIMEPWHDGEGVNSGFRISIPLE